MTKYLRNPREPLNASSGIHMSKVLLLLCNLWFWIPFHHLLIPTLPWLTSPYSLIYSSDDRILICGYCKISSWSQSQWEQTLGGCWGRHARRLSTRPDIFELAQAKNIHSVSIFGLGCSHKHFPEMLWSQFLKAYFLVFVAVSSNSAILGHKWATQRTR